MAQSISLQGKSLKELSELEWLETTATGAFASSTLSGANTRRYHALLVAGSGPDDSRNVLLSRLDETFISGKSRVSLASRFFESSVHLEGYKYLLKYDRDLFSELTFSFSINGVDYLLKKAIIACHKKSLIILRYRLEADRPDELDFSLEPFFAGRSYHSLLRNRSTPIDFKISHKEIQISSDDCKVFIGLPEYNIDNKNQWHRDIYYPNEKQRGYDYLEDLFLPATLITKIRTNHDLFIAVSDCSTEGMNFEDLFFEEIARRKELSTKVQSIRQRDLNLAADQFIVNSKSGATDIIAGYPWFTCWGRDSMLSLPGLCLATGRHKDARDILLHWKDQLSQGLIPNRIGVKELKFNTADATLLFVVAAYKYYLATEDREFLNLGTFEAIQEIIDWHIKGTFFDIVMDPEDGLLRAGSKETQLTWMDAAFKSVPVTPRWGKAVEINALWYNALCIYLEFARELGKDGLCSDFQRLVSQIKESFLEAFWSKEDQYLFDWTRGSERSSQLRPNQLFALSLPFSLLDKDKSILILNIVRDKLLTPFGLRTLAKDDPEYRGKYEGPLKQRDLSYHQGTVWPWLGGLYMQALWKVKGQEGLKEIEAVLGDICQSLSIAGVGSISEVFDGDLPQRPGGCVAQAWSVALLLEVMAQTPAVQG